MEGKEKEEVWELDESWKSDGGVGDSLTPKL